MSDRASPSAAVSSVDGAKLSYVCGGRDGAIGRFVLSMPTLLGGKDGHSIWRQIQFKVDGGGVVTALWRYDGHTATAAQPNNAREMAKLLEATSSLLVRAIDQNGKMVNARFDVSNAREALTAVEQRCGNVAPTVTGVRADNSLVQQASYKPQE